MTTNEIILRAAQLIIDRSEKRLAEFKEKLGADPVNAFSFSAEKAIEAAAQREAATSIIKSVHKGATREELIKRFTDTALFGAQFPAASTSTTSNVMQARRVSAAAEMADMLKCIK